MQAGLQVESIRSIVLLNERFDPDTYRRGMIGVIGARDAYFFGLNRYLLRVHRPQ